MNRLHDSSIIYETKDEIDIKEIRQGDIFKNIPYYSPDFLMKNLNQDNQEIKNETENIFQEIMRNGEVLAVESVIFPTWAILASQDCDIRKDYDLLFFPIVKYKELKEQDNKKKFIEDDIREWNRFMFLPKNYIDSSKVGPFRVLLQNPFYLSYEILEKNIKYCWVSHISDKARKIFLGKITNFFTRLPFDELIFLEFSEIEEYFQIKWLDAWNNKEKEFEESANELIDKIIELYYSFKEEEKDLDLKKIKIVDTELINQIFELIKKNCILKQKHEFEDLCNKFNEKKTDNCFSEFFNLIDKAIHAKDNIFEMFKGINEQINQFNDDNDPDFITFKDKFIKDDFQSLNLDLLKVRTQSALNQKEKYLTYCKPFERLKEFCERVELIMK